MNRKEAAASKYAKRQHAAKIAKVREIKRNITDFLNQLFRKKTT